MAGLESRQARLTGLARRPLFKRPFEMVGAWSAGALVAAAAGACGPGRGADDPAGATPLVFGSDGNIAVVSRDGGRRRVLTKVVGGSLARDPAWSPDGMRIAYSYTPPMPQTRGPGGLLPLPVTDVYVMGADGSGGQVLLDHGAPGVGYETPAWAPDGQSLYVTYTELVMEGNVVKDQILELARLPLGGGRRRTVAPNGLSPTVSPDGKRLAFVATQTDGQALLLSDADGRVVQPLIPQGTMDGLAAPRFSPDGRRIVFSAIAPMAPVPVPTAPARRGTTGSPPLAQGAPLSLVRAVRAHGLPMDVFVVGVEGGAPRRLTELGEDNPAAVWSPDGKEIAILAGGGIYLMNADGSALTSIDQRGGHGKIDWRPGSK